MMSETGVNYWQSTDFLLQKGVLDDFHQLLSKDWEVSECRDFCRGFVWECLGSILVSNCFLWETQNLSEALTDLQKEQAEQALTAFAISKNAGVPFWYPLNFIATYDFNGDHFILRKRPDFNLDGLRQKKLDDALTSPFFKDATSWLRVSARNLRVAEVKKRIVLGGFCARLDHPSRHIFTMGKPCDSYLSQKDGAISVHSSGEHVPCLAHPLVLSQQDEPWLKVLDEIAGGQTALKKSARCLRLFYTSWFTEGSEQFSMFCMAIDALTPSKLSAMRAKSVWALEKMRNEVDEWAIVALLKDLRSDVMHGDAPTLVEAKKYREFVGLYHQEPLDALGAITAELVRRCIFGKKMSERQNQINEYPEIIASKKKLYSRYGLEYKVPTNFDFETLKKGLKWPNSVEDPKILTRALAWIVKRIRPSPPDGA